MVMYELIADLSHILLQPELHHFLLSIRMFRQHERRRLATGRYSDTKRPDLYLTPQALHKCLQAHWASSPLRRLVYGAVDTAIPLRCRIPVMYSSSAGVRRLFAFSRDERWTSARSAGKGGGWRERFLR